MENKRIERVIWNVVSVCFIMSSFPHHSKESPLCVIWDCDGTLIDTEKQSSNIIADIMEEAKPGSREIE